MYTRSACLPQLDRAINEYSDILRRSSLAAGGACRAAQRRHAALLLARSAAYAAFSQQLRSIPAAQVCLRVCVWGVSSLVCLLQCCGCFGVGAGAWRRPSRADRRLGNGQRHAALFPAAAAHPVPGVQVPGALQRVAGVVRCACRAARRRASLACPPAVQPLPPAPALPAVQSESRALYAPDPCQLASLGLKDAEAAAVADPENPDALLHKV